MSRTRHRQRQKTAYQWNPPQIAPGAPDVFAHPQSVASANDCTGLAQRPALSRSDCDGYTALYPIHQQAPQDYAGKENPDGRPPGIHLHRQ